jgi:hypothetical protein
MPGLARARADAAISLLAIVDRSVSPHAEVPICRGCGADVRRPSGAGLWRSGAAILDASEAAGWPALAIVDCCNRHNSNGRMVLA